MHNWIETHGFECLLIAGLFSLVMSSAPPPPSQWGFWKLWAFNAAKSLGANASHLIQRNTEFQTLGLNSHSEEIAPNGATKTIDTKVDATVPKFQDKGD